MTDQLYTLSINSTEYGLLLNPSHVDGVAELLSSSYGQEVTLRAVPVAITDPLSLSDMLRGIGETALEAPRAAAE